MYDYKKFMAELERKNPSEPEFIQAASEIVASVIDTVNANPLYLKNKILDRITEPNRVVEFKVEWEDDNHEIQVNRGYRVQFNNAIGPYKGGLRFHSSVTLGTLKFLGFEQTFKNSLTTLPMGGGKGGSDFSPKGKSDNEIMRFCRSFMTELQKHIGPDTDVPAGDVGVGGREIGFMYGQYKRLRDENTGTLTGKGLEFGGSLIRPEATGYGALYYAEELLKDFGDTIKGKRIAISGYGNVAWGAAIKATQMGAKVVTISGSKGYVLDEDGVNTEEKWNYMLMMRAMNSGDLAGYAEHFGAKFFPGERPWNVPVDIAMPCAYQNELNQENAEALVKNGVKYIIETSNMGCTPEAVSVFKAAKIPFAPSKAANAGGVAVSGLEMTQNSQHLAWTAEEVDEKLHTIMVDIHAACVREGKQPDGSIDYIKGANIAGFKKVANAMCAQGY
ncbi:MAG: NADP-specific glutamate dehydrogenase [Sphaerochaetaceae bacterium]|nr:NADP-specific glutamate dehydrogenase [Sphaerochaetaceae bacterium]